MQKDIETLKKMKKVVEELYNTYLKQSNCCFSNSNDNNCWHDDSGGHPDYHCNQHDNTPVRIMVKCPNVKNVTN